MILCFQFFSAASSVSAATPANFVSYLMSNPLSFTLDIKDNEHTGLGKFAWWPWPKVMAVALINKKLPVCIIKWEPHIQSLKNICSYIPPVDDYPWLNCGKFLLETLFFGNFYPKISDVFFSRPNTLLAISSEPLVPLAWNKEEMHWLVTGSVMWYLRSYWSDWCVIKKKQISWILGW